MSTAYCPSSTSPSPPPTTGGCWPCSPTSSRPTEAPRTPPGASFVTHEVIAEPHTERYVRSNVRQHGTGPRTTVSGVDRRTALQLAPAPQPQPARTRPRGRRLVAARELPRDRPRPPEPRDGPAPGRAPRHSAPRAQPPPARGGLRPAVRGALARGAGDGARPPGPRPVPPRPRALPRR